MRRLMRGVGRRVANAWRVDGGDETATTADIGHGWQVDLGVRVGGASDADDGR
jgi:hypothetical protein